MVARNSKLLVIAVMVVSAFAAVAAQAAPGGPQARHQLSDAEMPLALLGEQFSYQFETPLHDPSPTYSVTEGSLPTGITLGGAGLLAGVPTEVGSSHFTVTASNGAGTDVSPPLTIVVGTVPSTTLGAAGAVGPASADLTAAVSPGNLATNAWFEYWKASDPASIGYTDLQTLPAGTEPVTIAAQLTGLTPDTDYRFRLTASNDASPQGTPSDTGSLTTLLPPPTAGETFNLEPVSGTTSTKCAGDKAFDKLTEPEQVTLDCQIDTTHGTVALTASKGSSGETQTAQFWGGMFRVFQERGDEKEAVLNLAGALRCEKRKTGKKGRAQRRERKRGGGRKLWGSGSGDYKTVGSHGAATVRGTIWLVADRCDGSTIIKVKRGTVVVRDFTAKASVILTAGEQYIAKAETGRLP